MSDMPNLLRSVGGAATRLQNQYLSTNADAAARGTLAELRKFAARPLEQNPLALEEVLLLLDPPLSERELGRGDAPSNSERAAFHALCLFGLHMQSASKPMHCKDISFAFACGELYYRSESRSIKPRFDAMQLASDEASRMVHVRSLVSLLRAYQIPCNYGRLADDFRKLMSPEQKDGVLLRWGRDFARGTSQSLAKENNTKDS